MDWALVAYRVGLVVSLLISATATVVAWRNRSERAAKPLAVLLAAATVWTASDILATFTAGTPLAVAGHKTGLTSVLVLVAAFLAFALEYTGRGEYLTRKTVAALAVEPVVVGALVWTADFHGLFWRSIAPDASSVDGVSTSLGPVYHVHTAYSYLLLAVAVVLVVVYALRSRYLYQRQIAAIVLATVVPWVANAVSLWLEARYNLTTLAFAVTGVAFTWAVVREDFLDITPIATEVVLDRIDTAVAVVDERGRVVDINEAACRLLDVETTDAVGADARSLLASEAGREMYDELSTRTESATEELALGEQYVRVQMSPLVDRRGEVVGRAFIVVDLTDQRRRQRELERRNEQLDRFAGVVSHDLRNPLQVAAGHLELAERTGEDEHFEEVQRAHDRMNELIEDLLAIARQDDDADRRQVAVGDAAESAWSYVETVDASLAVETDGTTVEADPDRLSQLFENLFRNAVEHAGDDVTVSVRPLSADDASGGDGNGAAGFSVVDDGPGFDDADPDAVFEDGYTTADSGTGYGLAIVAEIADQHGWRVSASDAERGARIDVVTERKGTVD